LFKAHPPWKYALAVGASLSLAILTKPTAYIYAFPFLVWLVFSRRWKSVFIIAIVALLINFGQYARNWELFGNPFGPGHSGERGFSNEAFTPSALASNVVRNITLHIGTPSVRINSLMEKGVVSLHALLGIDPNDPRTTWVTRSFEKFHIERLNTGESNAGNPAHLILIALSLALLFAPGCQENASGLRTYALLLTSSFLLFCIISKWHYCHARVHLPLFVLWSPFIAAIFSKINNPFNRNTAFLSVGLVLILLSVPYVFLNKSKKFMGENNIFALKWPDRYFFTRPERGRAYRGAVNYIKSKKYSDIGVILEENDWEYPFFVLFADEKSGRPFRIEHVNVDNVSSVRYGVRRFRDFSPSAVISLGAPEKDTLTVKGASFAKEWSEGGVDVFVRR
jgi:hypothetical protein